MVEWLERLTPNHKIVGSSPVQASWLTKKHPTWATGDDNGASVHSATDRDVLDYPWHHEACKQVYTVHTPREVEVINVTGLPWVIPVCKAI